MRTYSFNDQQFHYLLVLSLLLQIKLITPSILQRVPCECQLIVLYYLTMTVIARFLKVNVICDRTLLVWRDIPPFYDSYTVINFSKFLYLSIYKSTTQTHKKSVTYNVIHDDIILETVHVATRYKLISVNYWTDKACSSISCWKLVVCG